MPAAPAKKITIPTTPKRKVVAGKVQSLIKANTHSVVVPLEVTGQLVPGTNFGEWYLALDNQTTWAKYKALLVAMVKTGIISQKTYDDALANGYTQVPQVGSKDSKEPGGTILLENARLKQDNYRLRKALDQALAALRAAKADLVADAIEAEYAGKGN